VLALVFAVGVFPSVAWADQSGAAGAISNAKSQILTCYNAAKEAEAAGANITALAGALNEAGILLSKAESAFSAGDFVGAQNYAVQSQGKLASFVSNANALLIAAGAQRNQDFLINVVGSTVGTVAVIAGSVGLWFFLKKKYHREGED
jgi:hypothetical protein